MNILLGIVGFLIALLIGEFLYRWRKEPARLWGNLSQGFYAFVGLVIVGLLLLSTNGLTFIILMLLLVSYYWLFRVRVDDSKKDIRAMIGDAD